jgi:serine/threonine protein kinase
MDPLKENDPQEVKGWQLKGRIGSGGTGVVYLAQDSKNRIAAVKVLRSELSDNTMVRERLRREAEVLRRVEGGRTAVIYDVDVDCETPFIAMEYVRGLTLNEYVSQNKDVKGALAWTLIDALIEALKAIHAAGVIHRDLKPSNILIGEDGVKVVDFGISVLHDVAHSTQTGALIGTVAWLAPEQITGAEITEASDVFNLGMVLAFALTGVHPFGDGRADAIMFRIAYGEPDLSKVPKQFEPLISACLVKNPSDRPTLQNLSMILNGISRSGSNDSQPFNDGHTVIVDRTNLERSVQESSKKMESENSKVITNSENSSKPNFDVTQRAKVFSLIGVCLLVLTGIFAVIKNSESDSGDFASTTSVVEVLSSEPSPSSIIGSPKFKVGEFEGNGIRFDPCAGVITTAINYGSLSSTRQEEVTGIVQSALNDISGESGLEFIFTGATDSLPSNSYRDGRNGSKTILIGFLEPGEQGVKMIKKGEEYGFSARIGISPNSQNSQWVGIETANIQIVPSSFYPSATLGKTDMTRTVRRTLLKAIGLDWFQETSGSTTSNELMGADVSETATSPLKTIPDWGPGDLLGMKAVGKANGCID